MRADIQSGSRVLKRCSEPFLIYIYGIQCDLSVSPSLSFEEAGCLKNLPATSKGGRPHSDIASDFKAYQTKQFSRDIWCNSTTTIVPLVSTAFLLLASVIAGEDRKAF